MPVKVTGLENLPSVQPQSQARGPAVVRPAPQPPGPTVAENRAWRAANEAISARLLAVEKLARETQELARKLERRRSAAYVGDNLAVTRVLDRFIMYVDTRDLGVAPHILLDGEWEPHLTKVLSDLIKPKMTVVDVGANFGYYTLLAASLVTSEGRVYAFEPNPSTFKILSNNVGANWYGEWVRCFQCAILDVAKEVELFAGTSFVGASSIFLTEFVGEDYRRVRVPAKPLDEIVTGPVDVMKIDAEGSEPFVFEGMKRVLENSPNIKIVMEVNVAALHQAGIDPKTFLDKLAGLGFEAQFLTHYGTIEPPDQRVLVGPITNLLLSRNSSGGRRRQSWFS
jgi:FkbM family methyltransferase